ncbi:holo-ACP synthase [Litoribacillus peritrichatus]|uniref:Holo-[acyl-carrier-protein] synthase n=1 Tax=Litoribacillus peritrichatus TaxID=718191 RepID=A0ABP7N8Q0_9GAMM
MIVGIGTDICDISRIERAYDRQKKFAERILTENELAVFSDKAEPHRYLASRFAAKEAALKALGTGLANGITWQDIEISNLDSGQPVLTLAGRALEIATQKGVTSLHITLSDERDYAVGFVILER